MTEKLYQKLKLRDGRKMYASLIHGQHGVRLFKTATHAQAHSLRLRERLSRLRAVAKEEVK